MLTEAQRDVLRRLAVDGKRITCRRDLLGHCGCRVNVLLPRGGDVYWPLEVNEDDVYDLLDAQLIVRWAEGEQYPRDRCYVITAAGRQALGEGGEAGE